MSLELRRHHEPEELAYSVDLGGTRNPEDRSCDPRNVLVTSGIHRGRFPIGGLRVQQARDVLRRLVTIDDGAVAVINGRAVEEDELIGPDVTQISFVKPSSIKGRR
jgi:hypothetical protein